MTAIPMPSYQASQTKRAQDALARALRNLFGEKLVGVNAFGAGIDLQTREMSLRVTVDGPSSARRAAKLPDTIEGLPVRIWQGGAAEAE